MNTCIRGYGIQTKQKSIYKSLSRCKYLYVLFLPTLLYFIIFRYIPIYGLILAFKSFIPGQDFLAGEWLGLENFQSFFGSIYFGRTMKNTIILSIYQIILGIPVPVIFAIVVSEIRHKTAKRFVQTVSYLPHFLSVLVVVAIMKTMLNPSHPLGLVNVVITALGGQSINFFTSSFWFRPLYVGSGLWQGFGWASIIYLASIATIEPCLYESAQIEGAGKYQKMMYITIPHLVPTMVVLFLISTGNVLDIGFEKVFLMQNPSTYVVSDVISTYVYRTAFGAGRYGGSSRLDYSYATAVGLFNSTANLTIIVFFNWLSRRTTETSLW